MQLTAIEFAKLINDLKCDARPDERRTNPRAPTRAQLEVIPVLLSATGAPHIEKFRVRDISRTGMGLLTNRSIPELTRLIVLLPKNAAETLVLLCEIVRAQRLPGDMYHLGTRMVRRVTLIEHARFLAGAPGAAEALCAPPLTDAA